MSHISMLSKLVLLVLCALLHLAGAARGANSAACQAAIDAQGWLLEQFGPQGNPDVQALLETAAAKFGTPPAKLDQTAWFPTSFQSSWAPYTITNGVGVAPWGSTDLGEFQWAVSQVTKEWVNASTNPTIENTYGPWAEIMYSQAERLRALAEDGSNGWDALSRQSALLRAINFYTTGQWPFPSGFEGKEALDMVSAAFKQYLELVGTTQGIYSKTFDVPFNNGTATADLNAFFATPDPGAQLPLMVFILGTDTPKESMFEWFGPAFMARNYSVLFFDGPGQGLTARTEPFMPFYPAAEEYVAAVLDAALNDSAIADKVDPDRVGLLGFSFGGYLGGRACSYLGDRLSACVLTPPVPSMAANYQQKFSQGMYGPFQYVLETSASLLPPEVADALADPVANIMLPLLLDCSPDSDAPRLFNEAFLASPPPLDPELVYSAVGYAGMNSPEPEDIVGAQWAAYKHAMSFVNDAINQTQAPMFLAKGTEDDLIGGFEQAYFDALPAGVKAKSVLSVFDPESGGALHCQIGGLHLFLARVFAWLNPIMQG